jgi:RHS repeat-associated protein
MLTPLGGSLVPLRIVSKALITSGQSSTLPTIRFYNGLGQLIEENGGTSDGSQMSVAHTTYNAQGLKAQEYVPYTATFSWNYVAVDTSKPKTGYAYEALGRVTVVTHTDGTTVCTSYDGYRTLARDENSHQKLSENDAFGRLIRVKEYTGTYASPNWSATAYATTTYGYNLSDGLTRVTDTLGNTTAITYDALGRKTAMNDPDMGRWSYAYDNAGNLTSQTDAKAQAITFSYDRLKRLTAKTYPAGSGTSDVTYSYDSTSGGNQGKGQRTGMSDGTGSTAWAYDGRGRVVREAKTINGTGGGVFTTTWSYDAMDRVQTMVYPTGEVLTTTYNVLGLADGLKGTLAGQYSNFPYVASRSYNALGLPTQMVLSDTLVTRWGYYALGGAWDTHPALGLTSFGRLWYERTTTPSAGPVLDLRYNYDPVGNVTRAVNFRYAASGWPSSGFTFSDTFNSKDTSNWTWTDYVAVPFNDGGNNVARSTGTGSSWAANFNRSAYSLTSGRGLQLRFKVSASNTQAHFCIEANDPTYRRLAAVANDGKLYVQEMEGGSYRYPAELLANLQTNTWYTLSVVVDDSSGFYIEVCQVDNPAVRGSYHTWMPTGKSWRFHHWIWTGSAYVDEYREFNASGLDWSPKQWLAYTYDPLDRLTGVAPVAGWQGYTGAYTYSAIGNLTSKTEDGAAWAYTYPSSGAGSIRPHAVITVANVSSYGYDANGNMVTRTVGNDTYLLSYDAENRLKEVQKGGTPVASFGYDGDGKMVTATIGVTTTLYVGDYFERVNGITNTYYYHASKRVAVRVGNTLYWLLTDYLGSTSKLIAATGALTGELRFKAYGDARYAWGITTTTKYHFTGQREESTIGLYFDNARWYDPALGRFVQADSVVPSPADPQNLNRYTYVLDNPLRYIDASGHAICEDEECKELLRIPARIKERCTRAFWLVYMQMLRVLREKPFAFVRFANNLQSPLAQLNAAAKGAGQVVFASKVRQGGDWDMKAVMIRELQGYYQAKDMAFEVGGPIHYYDTPGNVAYAYWGRAAGYSLDLLLDAAGAAQCAGDIRKTVKTWDTRSLPRMQPGLGLPRAWDNPGDQEAIRSGGLLWDEHGEDVAPQDLLEALERALRTQASSP